MQACPVYLGCKDYTLERSIYTRQGVDVALSKVSDRLRRLWSFEEKLCEGVDVKTFKGALVALCDLVGANELRLLMIDHMRISRWERELDNLPSHTPSMCIKIIAVHKRGFQRKMRSRRTPALSFYVAVQNKHVRACNDAALRFIGDRTSDACYALLRMQGSAVSEPTTPRDAIRHLLR